MFVEYSNLLEDWYKEMKRIGEALDIELDTAEERAVQEFLTPDLRRERYCGPVADHFGADWISVVYQALLRAAQDGPLDVSTLDRVFDSYRASERDFRKAFAEFHDQSNSPARWIFRPFIVKRILQVAAIVHGQVQGRGV